MATLKQRIRAARQEMNAALDRLHRAEKKFYGSNPTASSEARLAELQHQFYKAKAQLIELRRLDTEEK